MTKNYVIKFGIDRLFDMFGLLCFWLSEATEALPAEAVEISRSQHINFILFIFNFEGHCARTLSVRT